MPVYSGVEVVDYGGGNVGSVLRALERLNIPYTLVSTGNQLSGQQPIVLPGVGSFGSVMQGLRERKFVEPLTDLTLKGVPFLGICVGQQILFESSEESPGVAGLDWLKGQVVKLQGQKVPQIGWNLIVPEQNYWPQGYVYYVNSYVAQPDDPEAVLYSSEYQGQRFCGAVFSQKQGRHLTAFQFHPEKSSVLGHQLLSLWWGLLG